MVVFTQDRPGTPGYRCQECQTEELVTGQRFTAAVEQRLQECRDAGHHVEAWGGLGNAEGR